MSSEEALQQFIDSCIRPDLQEFYPNVVSAIRIGWIAALKWSKQNGQ